MMSFELNLPRHNVPDLSKVEVINPKDASRFCENIVEQINEFNNCLDCNEEVCLNLVNFGQTYIFHVEELEVRNPNMVIFKGKLENGSRVELIQHISQINFLLMSTPRLQPELPKRKIGFTVKQE